MVLIIFDEEQTLSFDILFASGKVVEMEKKNDFHFRSILFYLIMKSFYIDEVFHVTETIKLVIKKRFFSFGLHKVQPPHMRGASASCEGGCASCCVHSTVRAITSKILNN